MNNRQFIAKQRVKYVWKSLKHTGRITGTSYRDNDTLDSMMFLGYENTPELH